MAGIGGHDGGVGGGQGRALRLKEKHLPPHPPQGRVEAGCSSLGVVGAATYADGC